MIIQNLYLNAFCKSVIYKQNLLHIFTGLNDLHMTHLIVGNSLNKLQPLNSVFPQTDA